MLLFNCWISVRPVAYISHADVEFDHEVNDALMRFFDQCARFVQEVENNPSALTEFDKFQQGPEMSQVQQKIADRLGVPYASITAGQCTVFKLKN